MISPASGVPVALETGCTGGTDGCADSVAVVFGVAVGCSVAVDEGEGVATDSVMSGGVVEIGIEDGVAAGAAVAAAVGDGCAVAETDTTEAWPHAPNSSKTAVSTAMIFRCFINCGYPLFISYSLSCIYIISLTMSNVNGG